MSLGSGLSAAYRPFRIIDWIFSSLRINKDLPCPVLSPTAERLVYCRQFHMGLPRLVVKEVDPTNGSYDATSPRIRLAAEQRRRTLAA